MSLDTPRYLSELFSNIRGRSIAWEAHARAGLITDSDVEKIRAIDKVPKEKQVSVVEKDVDGYAALILAPEGALRKATDGKRVDVVAYMLVLLGDLLEGVCNTFVYQSFEASPDLIAKTQGLGHPAMVNHVWLTSSADRVRCPRVHRLSFISP